MKITLKKSTKNFEIYKSKMRRKYFRKNLNYDFYEISVNAKQIFKK